MKDCPVKNITVNIIPKYTQDEWDNIWSEFYLKAKADQVRKNEQPEQEDV